MQSKNGNKINIFIVDFEKPKIEAIKRVKDFIIRFLNIFKLKRYILRKFEVILFL